MLYYNHLCNYFKIEHSWKDFLIICNVCDYLGEIASNQNHSRNAKIKISYGNHNRQLLSYRLSSTINNEVINMYPTGQKIGINSVENTFFGGQNIFFFFDISRNNLFILSKVENILFILSKMKKILFISIFSSTPPPPVIKWSDFIP